MVPRLPLLSKLDGNYLLYGMQAQSQLLIVCAAISALS